MYVGVGDEVLTTCVVELFIISLVCFFSATFKLARFSLLRNGQLSF